jgi:hypothetical protein
MAAEAEMSDDMKISGPWPEATNDSGIAALAVVKILHSELPSTTSYFIGIIPKFSVDLPTSYTKPEAWTRQIHDAITTSIMDAHLFSRSIFEMLQPSRTP